MAEPRTDQAYVESHESEYLTPAQEAQSKARYDIMSHSQDFLDAGIDVRYAELVATKASERVKVEFEAKQKEDPLKQIQDILLSSALTEDDKLIAEKSISDLEAHRLLWQAKIGAAKIRLEGRGEPFDFMVAFKQLAQYSQTPGFTEADIHSGEYFPHFYFVSGTRKADGEAILPSKDYLEGVLHKSGSLPANQHLDDLKLLPLDNQSEPKRGSKSYNSYTNKASHLPTNIPGAEATIFMTEKSPMVSIGVSAELLQKIVDFPGSI